jgi:hypothetical protein
MSSGGDLTVLGLFQRVGPSLDLAVSNRPNTLGSPPFAPTLPHLNIEIDTVSETLLFLLIIDNA